MANYITASNITIDSEFPFSSQSLMFIQDNTVNINNYLAQGIVRAAGITYSPSVFYFMAGSYIYYNTTVGLTLSNGAAFWKGQIYPFAAQSCNSPGGIVFLYASVSTAYPFSTVHSDDISYNDHLVQTVGFTISADSLVPPLQDIDGFIIL